MIKNNSLRFLLVVTCFHQAVAMDEHTVITKNLVDDQLMINFMNGDQSTKVYAHFPVIQSSTRNVGAITLTAHFAPQFKAGKHSQKILLTICKQPLMSDRQAPVDQLYEKMSMGGCFFYKNHQQLIKELKSLRDSQAAGQRVMVLTEVGKQTNIPVLVCPDNIKSFIQLFECNEASIKKNIATHSKSDRAFIVLLAGVIAIWVVNLCWVSKAGGPFALISMMPDLFIADTAMLLGLFLLMGIASHGE